MFRTTGFQQYSQWILPKTNTWCFLKSGMPLYTFIVSIHVVSCPLLPLCICLSLALLGASRGQEQGITRIKPRSLKHNIPAWLPLLGPTQLFFLKEWPPITQVHGHCDLLQRESALLRGTVLQQLDWLQDFHQNESCRFSTKKRITSGDGLCFIPCFFTYIYAGQNSQFMHFLLNPMTYLAKAFTKIISWTRLEPPQTKIWPPKSLMKCHRPYIHHQNLPGIPNSLPATKPKWPLPQVVFWLMSRGVLVIRDVHQFSQKITDLFRRFTT